LRFVARANRIEALVDPNEPQMPASISARQAAHFRVIGEGDSGTAQSAGICDAAQGAGATIALFIEDSPNFLEVRYELVIFRMALLFARRAQHR